MKSFTHIRDLAKYCKRNGLDLVYWKSRQYPGQPMPNVGIAVCIPYKPGRATQHVASFWHTQDGEIRKTK